MCFDVEHGALVNKCKYKQINVKCKCINSKCKYKQIQFNLGILMVDLNNLKKAKVF